MRVTYRLRKLRINILIRKGKGQASAKAPAAVEHIDTPKDTSGETARVWILEVIEKTLISVEAHLQSFSRSDANRPPRQQFLVTMEVIDTLF